MSLIRREMRLAFFLKLKKHDRIITLQNLRFFHAGKSEKKKKKKKKWMIIHTVTLSDCMCRNNFLKDPYAGFFVTYAAERCNF